MVFIVALVKSPIRQFKSNPLQVFKHLNTPCTVLLCTTTVIIIVKQNFIAVAVQDGANVSLLYMTLDILVDSAVDFASGGIGQCFRGPG